MNEFIALHPDVVLGVLKILGMLISTMFIGCLGLLVWVFKRMDSALKDLTSAVDHMKDLVHEVASSLTELWTEHRERSQVCVYERRKESRDGVDNIS